MSCLYPSMVHLQGLPLPEQEQRVQYAVTLPGAAAAQLLAMTPYYHKASPQQRGEVATADACQVSVDILVARYVLK